VPEVNRARPQQGRAADAARIAELTAENEALKAKMKTLFDFMAAVTRLVDLPAPLPEIARAPRRDGPVRLVTDSDIRRRGAASGSGR
jgi:hypothetical protein